jgi:hypothetical protein
MVQLRDDVVELRSLVGDACQNELCLHLSNQTAGFSDQNGGRLTATVDISAGCVPIVVSMLRRWSPMRVCVRSRYPALNLVTRWMTQGHNEVGRTCVLTAAKLV